MISDSVFTPPRPEGEAAGERDSEQLREALRKERALLDRLGRVATALAALDPDLGVVYANAATCRYFGVPPEQVRGLVDVGFDEKGRRAERLAAPFAGRGACFYSTLPLERGSSTS